MTLVSLAVAHERYAAGDLRGALTYLTDLDDAEAHNLRGAILARLGDMTGAEDALVHACLRRPGWSNPWVNLGRLLLANGRVADGMDVLAHASHLTPDERVVEQIAAGETTPAALMVLASRRPMPVNLASAGRYLVLTERRYRIGNNLLQRAIKQGNHDDAADALWFPEAIWALAIGYRALNCIDAALAVLEDGLQHYPTNLAIRGLLGSVCMAIGDYARARALLADVAHDQGSPEHIRTVPGALFTLQYSPYVTADTLADLHHTWGRQVVPEPPPRPRLRRFGPIPRVGLVGADFGTHPVGFFLDGFLQHVRGLDLYVYSGRSPDQHDALTERLQKSPAIKQWHRTDLTVDEALVEQIVSDEIDVLVDLAGHTAGNRLHGVFSKRPAPVQVTWGGYVGTTGLPTMDWLLSDHQQSPPEDDARAVETIWRMPDDYVCWRPPDYLDVDVATAPRTGPPVFGCFNNLLKVTSEVLLVWLRLLQETPGARLILKTKALGDPRLRQRVEAILGPVMDRVILEGDAKRATLLQRYNSIDVVLDPFPYSGGVTTLEALWMGVPTVTMHGDRFCSRHTYAHQYHVGLGHLRAYSPEDYIRTAQDLAEDRHYLAHLRTALRPTMLRSPLCDGVTYAQHWVAALTAMHEVEG